MTLSIAHEADQLRILRDGRPLTNYRFAAAFFKPHFWPVIGPLGDPVTRAFPNTADAPDEMHDHPHHRGLHFTHGEVAYPGEPFTDFWAEDAGIKQGRILHRAFDAGPNCNGAEATFGAVNDWLTPDGKRMLTERAHWRITDLGGGATAFALRSALSPVHRSISFLDTKEGSFAIRVATSMDEQKDETGPRSKDPRGVISNSLGKAGEKECWGRPADWVDYTGLVNGRKVGVAMFDHPDNRPRAKWHVRGYGLFAANPFGSRCFNPEHPAAELKLDPGQTLTLRYGLLVHPGDAGKERIAHHHADFVRTWS
ncbi:MAG: PmoA family protein [Planctomycetes bacterium]|nr:PmoA family protein [Planctomycetota bacterium]